ncbi:hypothetical protein D3C85_1858840 [compost metagenome]
MPDHFQQRVDRVHFNRHFGRDLHLREILINARASDVVRGQQRKLKLSHLLKGQRVLMFV